MTFRRQQRRRNVPLSPAALVMREEIPAQYRWKQKQSVAPEALSHMYKTKPGSAPPLPSQTASTSKPSKPSKPSRFHPMTLLLAPPAGHVFPTFHECFPLCALKCRHKQICSLTQAKMAAMNSATKVPECRHQCRSGQRDAKLRPRWYDSILVCESVCVMVM